MAEVFQAMTRNGGFYVMGNKDFLFDPLPCFSSKNAQFLVSLAHAMIAAGYVEDIYILPATQRVRETCLNTSSMDLMRIAYCVNNDGYADWRDEE